MNESVVGNLRYIMSTIKKSFLPAFLFACGMILFYAQNPYEENTSFSFHIAFYTVSFIGLSLLILINHSKPFFSFLTGVICYIALNWCKNKYGAAYISSIEYNWMCLILPLNLLIFYFLSPKKLQSRFSFYLLVFILAQLAFVQHFGDCIKALPNLDINFGAMPMEATAVWILILAPISIDISFKNTFITTGLFYADSCLFLGLMYSNTADGVTTFFLSFALILCCATFLGLYHQYNYDILENVGSYNSYLNRANNKFPYKYTIGLFSIDNRDKLLKILGENKLQELEQMLVSHILKQPYNIEMYRYAAPNELIMVFKNEDAKHTMEYVDNIRHTIAASEFILSNGKNLKITISASVSEKTRLDLNATSVTTRAHNALQKAYRFNCNIVTKA